MAFETIHGSVSKVHDDLVYEEIVQGRNHTLRIEIRSNSFPFQCHAKIERWNGERWEQMLRWSDQQMHTKPSLSYNKHASQADFEEDRNELLNLALKILRVR